MDAAAQQRMEQEHSPQAPPWRRNCSARGFEVGFYTNADVVPEGDDGAACPHAGQAAARGDHVRAMAHLRVRRKNSFSICSWLKISAPGSRGLDIALVSCYPRSPCLSGAGGGGCGRWATR